MEFVIIDGVRHEIPFAILGDREAVAAYIATLTTKPKKAKE